MSKANAPDTPPLLEESRLNPAETKVLNAFRGGWEAGQREVIVHPNGKSIIDSSTQGRKPAAGDWLGEDAILRAHFLRSLFLGSYDKHAPRLVTISCARIEGKLDLDYCEGRFPLRFFWCIFSEEISLRAATISELRLVKCLIDHNEQGFSISAPDMQVKTNVNLNRQFIAYGRVYLNGANIGGQLDCEGGYFKKGLAAQGLKAGGEVFLRNNFESDGLVDLNGANIAGPLDCTAGHFKKVLTAYNLKTGADVHLRTKFRSDDKIFLNGANIGGQLDCTGGHFKKGLIAQNLKTGEHVFLTNNSKFNGVVDLSGANIGEQLGCVGGHFEKGLIVENLTVEKDVFMSHGFKSVDVVNLNSANIGGQLICDGGHFGKGLIAQNLKTGKDVLLRDEFQSNGEVDLSAANISGVLDFTDTRFENGLVADGLRYHRIEHGGDWKKGLAWLSKMKEGAEEESSLQPYEQLMAVYRRMGKPDWAREIGFELERKRHKRSKRLWRAWYSILEWTIGYGYKPFRSLRWAMGLVAAGFLLFSSGYDGIVSKIAPPYLNAPVFLDNTFFANKWIPSEGVALKHWEEKKQAPQGYPKFNPFVYSLEATFPVLPLGQLDKWHPENTLFRMVRWVWTFTGSALLAILALFGVGTLGPNRKDESDGG